MAQIITNPSNSPLLSFTCSMLVNDCGSTFNNHSYGIYAIGSEEGNTIINTTGASFSGNTSGETNEAVNELGLILINRVEQTQGAERIFASYSKSSNI